MVKLAVRALQTARTAQNRHSLPNARCTAAGLGRVRGIEINVVGDEEVEAAIAIVIKEGAARRPAGVFVSCVVPEAGFAGDVGEGTVAVVVEKHVVSPEGDEEIDEAIVV